MGGLSLLRAAGRPAAAPWLVVVAALVTFAPAVGHDFVRWDDHVYLLDNAQYRGLDWPHLRWMFTTTLLGHYMPITWLSFGLDYTLWGMNPAGYHLTNVLLHAANAGLFVLVARRLLAAGGRFSPAALAAGSLAAGLFFALHPFRAASVAWATERRDVLSALLLFGSLLTHLGACEVTDRRRRGRLRAASVALYVLAFGAKAMVMTFPVVLVLLDLYPLRRLPAAPRRWLDPAVRRLWLEKLPYAVVAAAGAAVAWHAHTVVLPSAAYPWPSRVAVVFHGLWFYLSRTLAPVRLSPLYEFRVDPPMVLLAGTVVAAVTVAAWLGRRRWPGGLAAWAYYAIALAPVGGIVYANHLVADQHTYLPGLGWALLVGTLAAMLVRAAERGALRRGPAVALGGLLAAWLATLTVLTVDQVAVWRNTETLWRHAIAAYPDCITCHGSLGSWLVQRGEREKGLPHLERAATLSPERVWLRINIAATLESMGRTEDAITQYRLVIGRCDTGGPRCRREAAAAHWNLGLLLRGLGRADESAEHLRRAVELEPAFRNRPA